MELNFSRKSSEDQKNKTKVFTICSQDDKQTSKRNWKINSRFGRKCIIDGIAIGPLSLATPMEGTISPEIII